MTNAITFQSDPMNLSELCEMMKAGQFTEREMCELPTFGGEEPSNTEGIWSWDKARMIVGTCADDFRINWRPLRINVEACDDGLNYDVFVNGNYRTFSISDLLDPDVEYDYATLEEIEVDDDGTELLYVEDGIEEVILAIDTFFADVVECPAPTTKSLFIMRTRRAIKGDFSSPRLVWGYFATERDGQPVATTVVEGADLLAISKEADKIIYCETVDWAHYLYDELHSKHNEETTND